MTATPVFDEIIDLMATLPPEKLLEFHPSEKMQKRIDSLVEKKREDTLTEEEKSELEKVLILEHIVRMAKARVLKKIRA